MKTILKWLLGLLLTGGLLLAAVGAALAWWLSGDSLRQQLQAQASERLGLPVQVAKLSLSLFPLPAVAVSGILIGTAEPLSAEHIALRPAWGSLLAAGAQPRELELLSLTLKGLKLPQRGLDQLQQLLSKKEQAAQISQGAQGQKASKPGTSEPSSLALGLLAIPQQLVLERVSWQSSTGETLILSGSVQLNAARDQAQLALQLGGGTITGPLRLTGLRPDAGKAAPVLLRGELVTRQVDVSALPGLRARLAGQLQATTTLEASAEAVSQLGTALQTRTQFSVKGAVLKGLDLAKAVRTLGLSRGGETALSQLSGQLSTRGSGAAMQLNLNDLKASSSLLSASGAVAVAAASRPGAARALSGKVSVDLLGGEGVGKAVGALVGIPLEISGTTDAPQVQPTRGAMIGGAIGSVMAPVIGTGAGAKLGDKASEKLGSLKERLFGK